MDLAQPHQVVALGFTSLATVALAQLVQMPSYDVFLAVKHVIIMLRNLGPTGYFVGCVTAGLAILSNMAAVSATNPILRDRYEGITEMLVLASGCLMSNSPAFFLGALAFKYFRRHRVRAVGIVLLAGMANIFPGLIEVLVPEPRLGLLEGLWVAFNG
jgi:biotin transporter BioY